MNQPPSRPNDEPGDPQTQPKASTKSAEQLDATRLEPKANQSKDNSHPAVDSDGATAPAKVNDRTDETAFHLTPRDQRLVAGFAVIALVLLSVHWLRLSGWGTRPIELERIQPRPSEYTIDANTATWVEFAQLEGVGQTLGQRIVEDRDANGPFRSIDDLLRVKGIGPKTIEDMRPWLVVHPVDNAAIQAPVESAAASD